MKLPCFLSWQLGYRENVVKLHRWWTDGFIFGSWFDHRWTMVESCSDRPRAGLQLLHAATASPQANVVPNTFVTKMLSRLGPQKLKLSRSSPARFRAMEVTHLFQPADQPCDGALYNGWCPSATRLHFGRWARNCATSVA